ncbi:MAG: SPOR domain-containing protein [Polynucleobacter sp.]|nr:SPOR domain-containing protein [Polynucleobacter sp.]
MMKKTSQPIGSPSHPVAHGDREFGGTILGLVIGLVIGLGLALAVAFYISKTPPQERPGVKALNLPLSIKPAAPPETVPSEEEKPATQIDLNKPLQGKSPAVPSISADPIADIATGKAAADAAASAKADAKTEAVFFVQTGAFASQPEADAQKASLAMQGMQSQISEGLVDGKAVWRVRIGPFANVDDSGIVRSKLTGMGIKPAVIKVNK